MKKPKKPNLKLRAALPGRRRRPDTEERFREALQTVPRITNDTVAEHREEVLSSARKFIYPLQHSKHRVVRTSIALLAVALVAFLIYCGLALYRFQDTSTFMYDVTRVLPFPAAKAGPSWVSYESYLFELRRNMHYYRTQQQANFATADGKAQLKRLKSQAMDQVIQDAYVKQLARQHGASVSNREVDSEVALVRSQNRLGNSDRVFREVLDEFWGWNENDFKRELKQQLLKQAVVAKLDTATNSKAAAVAQQAQGGADFAALAAQYSEDPASRGNGGQYPQPLKPNDHDVAPAITEAVFRLQPGQVSQPITTGYTLEIIKVLDESGSTRHAAHIQFNYKDVGTYVQPLAAKHPPHTYIKAR